MKPTVVKYEDHFRLDAMHTSEFYLDILSENMPCTGCTHAQKCGDKKLACFAFALYVKDGSVNWTIPRLPSKRIYKQVMFFDTPAFTKEVNEYAKDNTPL